MKILSMPKGAPAIPNNVTGTIYGNTQSSSFLSQDGITYNWVALGGGYGYVEVPSVVKMNYIGAQKWELSSDYNGTISASSIGTLTFSAGTTLVVTITSDSNVTIHFVS